MILFSIYLGLFKVKQKIVIFFVSFLAEKEKLFKFLKG
ncbi:hypothetical protein PHEL85_2079 [Polaribacter sp. Hel1_85]|nr:hypothetical protein PHEL85_2079 [Polaribacter sp. Hel1_85]